MPRKSEVMQMDIQREFCSAMQELREIWDEIGIPDDQIDTRGGTVLMHIRNLLTEMVSEEKNLKSTMLVKIDRFQAEVADLSTKLNLPPYEMPFGMTIMEREKDLRLCVNRLNKLKRERLCLLTSLKSVEQELCDQLCATPCYIATGSIPSEEQLEQLKDHIETLKTEKQRRKEMFSTKKAEIISMYSELDLNPQTSFAQELITEEMDSYCLSRGKLDELEDLRKGLTDQKCKALLLVESLWSKINSLWNCLEIPLSEREAVKKNCSGIKPAHIEHLKKVLEVLEVEKVANLQKLTERARLEISKLWEKCFYSAKQRHNFSFAFDENYTEDLLKKHEQELVKMHTYYEQHQDMFANVLKWQQLFQRMLELEARAHDINRYSNRGGNLLQEERERKKIHKQLPRIEEELFNSIEIWEEQQGTPFLVEGIRFSDYVHSQWEACEKRKETEKQIRHEKKQQEMQSEMAYGSTPKTPTKRRFIGTTTLIKTPTSAAKKAKRAPTNSTLRSTSVAFMHGNRTPNAARASPGKPPLSGRLCTVGSGLKLQGATVPRNVLKETKMNVQTKTSGSVKSAPVNRQCDFDNTFIKQLSTTVVSSNTAGSADSVVSMPLPEMTGTPYCDFAAEINSNAKENKVRSSAIGDYARV
ncbi:unnamed protein product [Clavelina lepadiformis]|uniref:Protein regulator of cytokinesis 1 n=1 Tax=Clavelina lepadiformis TaxID=159417 RepID=A0ABP0GC08_CLALP